jgi:hypothetical protein
MAATDARPVPKKNVAYRHYFSIRKNDGTLITTWAGMDSEVDKDAAGFSDCTNEATEIGTTGVGYIDLTSTEMNADCTNLKVTVTNTGAIPYVVHFFPEEGGDIRCDTNYWNGSAVATPTQSGVPEVDVTYVNGSAAIGSGTPDVNVASLTAGAITTAAFTAGAINAAAIADAAIDAATFAAGAITATVIADNAIDAASIAADARTIFWTTALTEAYAADGAAFTGAQALYMIFSALGEFSISGTTITCKKLDGSTTSMTYTIDDASSPTSRTKAS